MWLKWPHLLVLCLLQGCSERSKVTLRHWYSVIPALPVVHYGGHSIKQHTQAKEGSLSQDHNWNKCEKVAGNAFRHHVFMEPKPRPQRAYALFFPSPPFLPLLKPSPFLGWTGPQNLPEMPGTLPQVGTGETYPSSTVTEFMRRQRVIVTLFLMTQDEPMTECLMDDFSPTCVSGPMRLSPPIWKRQI